MKKGTKLAFILLASFVLGAILHNLIYGIFHFEEAVFFVLSILAGLAFLGLTLVNLVTFFVKGEPHDLWRMGWLGLLGLLAILPGFGGKFYRLFAFFFFFSLRLIQIKKRA